MQCAMPGGGLREIDGETDLFIYPGFEFRATGAMLTNFHLPRTSLLLLVCAFAGKDLALAAYLVLLIGAGVLASRLVAREGEYR